MNLNDDPRLTAYSLGEMTDAERADFEGELAANPAEQTAARSQIESIRALAAGLTSELKAEVDSPSALGESHRLSPAQHERGAHATKSRRVPRWMLTAAASVVVGGLAFAIFAPSLNRARETAYGLRPVGMSIASYMNENRVAAGMPPAVSQQLLMTHNLPGAVAEAQRGAAAIVAGPKLGFGDQPVEFTKSPFSGVHQDSAVTPPKPTVVDAEVPARPFDANDTVLLPIADDDRQAAATAPPGGLKSVEPVSDGLVKTVNINLQAAAEAEMQHQVLETQLNKVLREKRDSERRIRDRDATTAESYAAINDNPFRDVYASPLSTFGIDVDTASYSNVRRYLENSQRPPADAVRIEELINYFPTSDAPPTDGKPFAVHMEVAACPWQPEHRLVRIALKGKEVAKEERARANLVFLIDVSGSMNEPNKLPLVKRSLRKLVGQLGENDRVAMVVYAGNSGLALPSTSAADKAAILKAIDNLEAGGSTNGGEGIQLAYQTAMEYFAKEKSNRVILCTDGDFNVGITDRTALFDMIAEKAKAGVFLNVLGFGTGNVKDDTMEGLADKGNGQYGYIDSDREADKVFVEQVAGTLQTIAKDVKLQLEFNPATVKSYRLIGYENRVLRTEDFNNDLKDSGDMGAGHSVVALYEIDPARQGHFSDPVASPELKYQPATKVVDKKPVSANANELLTLKLRYKKPDAPLEQGTSELIETALDDRADATMEKASLDMRFDASVAGFGMLLRESPYRGNDAWDLVRSLARSGIGDDVGGHRSEFLNLIDVAEKARP